MIEKICETNCCGCTACSCVCPKNAISFKEDSKGFLTPVVSENCIDCHLCQKVCGSAVTFSKPRKTFIAKLSDPARQAASQSGGAFAAVSDAVLAAGGVVYGCAVDEKFEAVHIRAASPEERDLLRGSKYIQSRLEDTFVKVAEDLGKGKVLFSGTSCQVAGLLKYLQAKHISTDSLITMDIICHGVPSVRLWRDLIAYYTKKAGGAKLTAVNFRDKSKGGWGTHNAVFRFGSTEFTDSYHKSLFYSNLALRESCYTCPYAKAERISDITVGDAWGVKKSDPDFFDSKGVSIIMFNTEKAMGIAETVLAPLTSREVKLENYMQDPLKHPSTPHRSVKEFWHDYDNHSFGFIIAKYGKNNPVLNWKYVIKKIRRKLHV